MSQALGAPSADVTMTDAREKYRLARAAIDAETIPELKRARIRNAFVLAQLVQVIARDEAARTPPRETLA